MNELSKEFDIIILSPDKKWANHRLSSKAKFFYLNLPGRHPLNRFSNPIFRLAAGYIEQIQLQKLAKIWLRKIQPDLIFLTVDHKSIYYYLINYANCSSILPQTTLYTEASILLDYNERFLSHFWPKRVIQKLIFKIYNNRFYQYREPFMYSLGKRLAGYKQKFMTKGGNVTCFVVNGPHFQDFYTRFGISSTKIKALGSLEHDAIYQASRNLLTSPKQINSRFKIIFFLTPMFGGDPADDAVSEFKYLMKQILSSFGDKVEIFLKPHPLDVRKQYLTELQKFCVSPNIQLIETLGYESQERLTSLIHSADLSVHSISSVMFTIFALKKPSLIYISKNHPYYSPSHKAFFSKYSYFVDESNHFISTLEMLIKDSIFFQMESQKRAEAYANDYMILDGNNIRRYYEQIKILVDN